MSQVELVIARYQEDISWLSEVPRHVDVLLYNKGPFGEHIGLGDVAPQARHVWLPNEGREAGTYLWHITRRYECLAPVTVFLQGNPHAHAQRIVTEPEDMEGEVFLPLSTHVAVDDGQGLPNHHHLPGAGDLPVARIYEFAFHRQAPQTFQFSPGAQFAVTRDCIRSKPREWWWSLDDYCRETYPESWPWALERVWKYLMLEPL